MPSYYDKIATFMNALVIAGSSIIVISISYDFFNNLSLESNTYISLKVQFWICMTYIVDYIVRFIGAKNKVRFFFRNLLLLAISIPYLNISHYYNISLNQEWITILRVLPVIRGGYAIVLFFYKVTRSRLSTLFVSYITFVAFISYFTTMIFFYAERVVNPMVNDYGDALWWTFMNLTTVGSNIYAMTTLGKFLSVLIAAVGMMMFPIFTAYITDIFQYKHSKRISHTKQNNE